MVARVDLLCNHLFEAKFWSWNIFLEEKLSDAKLEACVGLNPVNCAYVDVELLALLWGHEIEKLIDLPGLIDPCVVNEVVE
jgi:hypothetical protein